MNFETIMASLPRMTTAQLRQIKATCDMRLRANGSDDPLGSFETIVLNCVVEALKPRMFTSAQICRHASVYPSFRDKMEDLERFFVRSALNRLQQQWLVGLGLRLMMQDTRSWSRPPIVDHSFVMANIHRLPAHLNRSFPGYAENGVLGKIARHGKG